MKVEMIMPQMGESIAEGKIEKWRKGVGDKVELDEDILEISTDKVDSEIPAPAAGIITEILVPEGETVSINTVVAIIETEGNGEVAGKVESSEEKSEDDEQTEPKRPSAMDSSPHDASDHGGLQVREFKRAPRAAVEKADLPKGKKSTFISPLVQNIAADEGIPIDEVMQIPGSGRDGRVTKKDILGYVADRKVAAESKSSEVPAQPEPKPAPTPTPPAPSREQQPPVWKSPTDELVEMDRMRRMIADHMVKSVQTSPHVVSYHEVDMNRIVAHRESIKTGFKEREGINITYTAYFIYLTAKALQEFPYINASVDGYNIRLRRQINIGFAVELPSGGLIVPVIKNVDNLNLKGVARGLHELAEKARNGRLDPDDVAGGTFTVTNVGVFGSISGAPIINQPQVGILGTGAIKKAPAVIETPAGDALAIRWKMIMSMSYDHRLIDGAMAGRFLARLAQLMEEFEAG